MRVLPCDSAFQPMRFHAKSPLVYEQITSSLANESARFMIDKNVVWDSTSVNMVVFLGGSMGFLFSLKVVLLVKNKVQYFYILIVGLIFLYEQFLLIF